MAEARGRREKTVDPAALASDDGSVVSKGTFVPVSHQGGDSFDELALVHQAVGGCVAALQELLLHHHDRLRASVAQSVPRAGQALISADDVCQDAYAATCQAITTFVWSGEDSFFAWLRTIAMRRLADAIRRQSAAKRGGGSAANVVGDAVSASVADLLALVARYDRTPSQSAAEHEASALVNSAIRQLSADHQQVIQLRYFEGRSIAEVAAEIGRTPQATQMLCGRAVDALERALINRGEIFK